MLLDEKPQTEIPPPPTDTLVKECAAGAVQPQTTPPFSWLWCWAACASMAHEWATAKPIAQVEVANVVQPGGMPFCDEFGMCNFAVEDKVIEVLYQDWGLLPKPVDGAYPNAEYNAAALTGTALEQVLCPGDTIVQVGLGAKEGGLGHFILIDACFIDGQSTWFRYLDPAVGGDGVGRAEHRELASFADGELVWETTFKLGPRQVLG